MWCFILHRYLTEREKKLKNRREQFEQLQKRQNELTDWKKKIKDQERQLKKDIKRALHSEKDTSLTKNSSDLKGKIIALYTKFVG